MPKAETELGRRESLGREKRPPLQKKPKAGKKLLKKVVRAGTGDKKKKKWGKVCGAEGGGPLWCGQKQCKGQSGSG
ncbi:hypothetical protein ACH5RR_041437 [Cinchona calisaya]|uniref:40S ribosomal protein S25 n=1 Tax=Cinchona calisaya TaxID=153742 RepID=A0ABD2XXJ4_9GENT